MSGFSPYRSEPYLLAPARSIGLHRLGYCAPDPAWRPDISLPLRDALPWPWDRIYTDTYDQDFQPVKYWRNANALALFLEAKPSEEDAAAAKELILRLVARMREFSRHGDNHCLIESRFDFIQPGLECRAPWVSGIVNAFAILGHGRIREVMPEVDGLDEDIRRYANAYRRPFVECVGGPEDWISFVTAQGHLWFEEYPMAEGKPNLVLNGHIFAIFALMVAHDVWPKEGYDTLVRAGACTVAENMENLMQAGKPNLYSLRGRKKNDYLPARTVRQQYELYAVTGDPRFLAFAIQSAKNLEGFVDRAGNSLTIASGDSRIRWRQKFEATQKAAAPAPAKHA